MNTRTVLLALLFLFACSETFERTYKTRTEAEYDGAIAAGWVPSWLPQDAMEIREAHTIDTNAVMVRFSYPKEREVKVPHSCSRIAGSTAPPAPFQRAWWPESVPGQEGTVERYEYHKCGELYVALLHSEGEGFVWSGMRPLRGGAWSGGNDAQPSAAADRPTVPLRAAVVRRLSFGVGRHNMSTLEDLADRLALVCRLLDRSAQDVRELQPSLPADHIRTLGEAMAKVFEVQRAIFSVRPDLEPAFLKERSPNPEADRRLTARLSEAYELVEEGRSTEAASRLRAFAAEESAEFHKRIATYEASRIEGELKE